MRNEFASEGFGQKALVELAQQFQRLCGLDGEAVDLGECGFNPADDLALFVAGRKRDTYWAQGGIGRLDRLLCWFCFNKGLWNRIACPEPEP